MSKKRISIKEIAEISGVSIATISRVINNNGRFSIKTGKHIREILEEYHYVPNLVTKGLRTNRVQVIGIIVPDITNEYFARITLEIQNNFFDLGYSTIICNTNELKDVEKRHIAMLESQKVSGIVYISGEFIEETNLLDNIPTVYIDRKPSSYLKSNQYVLIESDNI